MIKQSTPILLFISYASEDESLLKTLENHLSPLQKQGLIRIWQKRQITAGTNWSKEIDRRLEDASIILLLISADFFASDYCYGIEMERALQRHDAGKALVIPIFLRPVDWIRAPFAHLQGLPSTGRAVTEWQIPDLAFREIAQSLRYIIEGPSDSKDASYQQAIGIEPPYMPPPPNSPLPAKGISRRVAVVGAVGLVTVTLSTLGFFFYHPTSSTSIPTPIVTKTSKPTSTPIISTNSDPTSTPTSSTSAIKYSGKLTSDTLNGQSAAMHLALTSLDQSNTTFTGTLTVEPPLTDRGGNVNGTIDNNGAITRFIVSGTNTISPALNFEVTKHLDSFYSGTYSGTTLDGNHNYLESGTWQMTRS